MKILAVFLLLVSLSPTEADDKKPEVTTQTATTADGRTVILKSDGTWEYVQQPPAAPAPVATPKETKTVEVQKNEKTVAPAPVAVPKVVARGDLSFQAAVVADSGNEKPIEGATFYLLDSDLNNILQSADLKPDKRLSLLRTFAMANFGASMGIERSVKSFARAMDAVKTHIVATAISDTNGKGQFSSVAEGTYYLMNTSVISRTTGGLNDRMPVVWNVRVQIHEGANSIRLDQNNAVP